MTVINNDELRLLGSNGETITISANPHGAAAVVNYVLDGVLVPGPNLTFVLNKAAQTSHKLLVTAVYAVANSGRYTFTAAGSVNPGNKVPHEEFQSEGEKFDSFIYRIFVQ